MIMFWWCHDDVINPCVLFRSNVQLDELLSSILINKNEYSAVLHWNDVFDRFVSKMTAACQITFPGSEPQIRKGSLEHINLDVKQRGANKKVSCAIRLYFITKIFHS